MKGRRRRSLLAALLLVLLCWVLPSAATARPEGRPLDTGMVEVQPNTPDSSPVQYPLTGSGDVTVDPANAGQQPSPGFWANLWAQIKGGAGAAWDWTKTAAGGAWDWTKGAAGVAWDWTKQAALTTWDWMQSIGNSVGNWWDGLPDWAQGAIKGVGVALGVIAVVVVGIIALPAEIVAAIVAAVGGIGVLIGAGIGALAGGTFYGAKVGGANFNLGYALLATVGGGILGGLVVSPAFLGLAGRALTGAGRLLSSTWTILSRGWVLNGGWKGFVASGLKSVRVGFIWRLVTDLVADGQLSSPASYLSNAVSDFFVASIVGTFAKGFVATRSAKDLRAFYNVTFFGGRLKPVQLLNSLKARWAKLLLWGKGLRGKALERALYKELKPTNTAWKAGAQWVGFFVSKGIKKAVSYTRKFVSWLRKERTGEESSEA